MVMCIDLKCRMDFDAEEALLQAQVLAAGQVQTQASILAGPGLGPYPVRHNRSLPNAALKARGRQPKLAVSGVPAAAVEPVQLDSQLDALRREIARLEQQKQKQVATKAVPARPVSSGSAAARVTQKGPNVPSPGKPPAIGGSSSAEQNGAATAGMPTIQPVATSYGATSEATVRVSITSTADGSPTKSGANSKRARPAADGASGPGNPSRSANATQHAGGHATSANGGITDICPEAQLAANEFLLSFMSQIGSEEQGRGGADPAVALTPPQHQGLETSAEAQEHYGQQHPEQSQHPNPRSGNPGDGNAGCLGAGTGQNEHGGHASIGGKPLAERAKNAPTPGCGGGASARRAAAERTSAAVQRLRRKSSGVAGTELLLRTATSSGMAANGAAPVASDVTAAADGGPPSVLVCATSPTYADGVAKSNSKQCWVRESLPRLKLLQQQLQRQLDQRQQQQRTFDRPQDAFATSGVPNAAGIMGVGAATGTSAPRASTPAADALRRPPAATAGTATPAANVLPPLPMPVSAPHTLGSAVQPVHPGAPSGMLPSATASQFPYPQLSHALGPRPLPGGSFPSAFLPGPPPGMQCRPSQPGVFLGAMQPPVSLVEVDVLARKELILLKWQMLQEIAVDLEAEWTEVCLAHNRLRMLSLTQAQHGRSAAAAVLADGPPGRSDAPQIGPPFRPEIALPALHPHPVMRGHATFHPFTQLSQQQLSQRQEQQTGGHQGPKQQSASGQEVPLLTPAPGQSVNVQLAAPRPMALQDVRGGRFLATPPAEMQTAALENGAGDRQPNGARHGDAPAEARGAPDPAQLHLRSGQCPGGEETCPNSQFHVPDKQSRHPDQREREPVQPRAPERELGSEPASRVEGERAANTGPGLAAERGPLLAGSDISTAARNSAPVERHPNGDPAAAVQQHDAAVPRALAHRDLATAALRLESHGGGLSAPLAQQPWLIAAGTRSPPPGASLPLGATCISANGPAVRMAPAAAPQVGERQPGSDLVGGLAGSASAGVGFTGVDGPQQHSRQHAGVQQQQVGMPQAAHDCDTAGPRDGAADAWRSGGDPRVNQAFLLTTGMEDQAAVSTVTYEDAARGIGQAMLSGPARHLPALTCGGSADGRTTGDGRGGGPGPSVQQRTSVWMPWEHAGAPEAPPGLGEGSGEARSNVVGGAGHSTVAAATHSGGGGTAGWGDGGEGDSGQSVGVTTGPLAGNPAPASAAPAFTAPNPAAVAPVEPPVRVQSAPQVLPARRPSGGSPGAAIAAATPRQEQQAPRVPLHGLAAAREETAPRPGSFQVLLRRRPTLVGAAFGHVAGPAKSNCILHDTRSGVTLW
ncbi:hypothetical protein VOLCADRAFT_86631 [Volvox carteri f. nagariensis]|uniref:Uncharacterized protein n=1 Tax=Volvox carteri f. nagariensis TaxID=3068 RepID=D8TJ67_VOLCA|nr:uncharacterized protein VOLCADRAFT_86631 [Volvox carteri f. nagariensis]EFJ52485.1 hypothetical protein VOLCADRAFT_86631 [Volvox carteri f. nagariensis]|eukprot:XP_002946558.1 hypothetical protein VOLCADRAFT_86631 [Volvox carteri f. nagariensis]